MSKTFDEIFSDIEYLLKGYSQQYRTSVQPYRYLAHSKHPGYTYEPTVQLVRESLLEHVGTLPILASYFHGNVTESVNLGRALEMLAIHDIGELVIGDESVFTKLNESRSKETEAALALLTLRQQEAYLEFEAMETNESRFAKSIDKIAPDLFDALCDPKITIIRLKHFANLEPSQIIPAIERKKSPYMEWSEFFRGFHAALMERLRQMFDQAFISVGDL